MFYITCYQWFLMITFIFLFYIYLFIHLFICLFIYIFSLLFFNLGIYGLKYFSQVAHKPIPKTATNPMNSRKLTIFGGKGGVGNAIFVLLWYNYIFVFVCFI